MIDELRYDSWNDFKRDFTRDLFQDGIYEKDVYLFRGQGEECWKLISYFQREFGKVIEWDRQQEVEDSLLEYFQAHCKRYFDDDITEGLDKEQLRILAQHYHVPTKLLDWSYSPYIAAFFAFSRCYGTDDSDSVAIWVLKKNHRIWNDKSGVRIVEDQVNVNKRQRWQQGCFTVIEYSEDSVDSYVADREKKGCDVKNALVKMTIPKSERLQALAELEAMNITYPVILGGIESCGMSAVLDVQMKYIK